MEYKYELHLHTCEGSACARDTAADMVKAHHQAGYQGLVVTDHFFNGNSCIDRSLPWEQRVKLYCRGYEHARAAGAQYDMDILFGIEFGTFAGEGHGREFLIYGVDQQFLLQNPDLLSLNRAECAKRIHAWGGYIVHAHPFRQAPYIDDSTPPDPAGLDGVEVYNHGNLRGEQDPGWNDQALAFARRYDLDMLSGSDTHWVQSTGGGGMVFDHRIRDSRALIDALKSRAGKLIWNRQPREIRYQ